MITLEEIATACGPEYRVHRLGGNVYGVTNFRHTITIDGGAWQADGAAELWITAADTGMDEFTGTITRAPEVPTILATIETE